MHQTGLSSGQIVTYDVGCPTSFASPSSIEQAVLQFKTQGVKNVTEVEDNLDFSNFTTIVQQ